MAEIGNLSDFLSIFRGNSKEVDEKVNNRVQSRIYIATSCTILLFNHLKINRIVSYRIVLRALRLGTIIDTRLVVVWRTWCDNDHREWSCYWWWWWWCNPILVRSCRLLRLARALSIFYKDKKKKKDAGGVVLLSGNRWAAFSRLYIHITYSTWLRAWWCTCSLCCAVVPLWKSISVVNLIVKDVVDLNKIFFLWISPFLLM